MIKLINLLTVSVLFLYGNHHYKGQSQKALNPAVQSDNQISYLFFKIAKQDSQPEKITLVEKKTVAGKMKSIPSLSLEDAKNGDLLITLVDSGGKMIAQQIIEDPLNPELESFGDKIERHKLTLKETEFSVRFPFSKETKSVKIEKISDSSKKLLFIQNF